LNTWRDGNGAALRAILAHYEFWRDEQRGMSAPKSSSARSTRPAASVEHGLAAGDFPRSPDIDSRLVDDAGFGNNSYWVTVRPFLTEGDTP